MLSKLSLSGQRGVNMGMNVTQITEFTRSRCKIYIDQEFAFVLYKGELRLYRIREGEDIADDNYCTIMKEVLPRRAKLRCMNLLKSREYTEAQLRGKLQQGFYPEAVIDEAIAYMASCHYIDDLRYAVRYLSCYETTRSQRRMEQDLWKKGIAGAVVEQALIEWEAESGGQDEMAMIRKLLEKKKYNASTADLKEQQRIYAFLMRKGYSAGGIRKAMKLQTADYCG